MARIGGIDLDRNKRIDIALTYIYGIGRSKARKILMDNKLDGGMRVRELKEKEVLKLREFIEKNVKIEGELRAEINLNIKRLMDINCYRGLRHRKGLTVRGQRTKTNAKTRKGKKGMVIKKKKRV